MNTVTVKPSFRPLEIRPLADGGLTGVDGGAAALALRETSELRSLADAALDAVMGGSVLFCLGYEIGSRIPPRGEMMWGIMTAIDNFKHGR